MKIVYCSGAQEKGAKRGKGGHCPSDPVSTPFLILSFVFIY